MTKNVLNITFQEYERYGEGQTHRVRVYGNSLVDCLKKLCENYEGFSFYFDNEEGSYDESMFESEIIDDIECNNGDGCNYITYLQYNNRKYIDGEEFEVEVID